VGERGSSVFVEKSKKGGVGALVLNCLVDREKVGKSRQRGQVGGEFRTRKKIYRKFRKE